MNACRRSDQLNTPAFRVTSGMCFALAALGLILPWMHSRDNFTQALYWSFSLAGAWTTLVTILLLAFRRRNKWLLLLGAPIALFWPAIIFSLFVVGAIWGPGSGFP
jgi:hypothetical protein